MMAIPVFDLSRVLEWVASRAVDAAKFVLLRAFVLAIAFTVVPVSLYLAWLYLGEKILTFITSQMGSVGFQSSMVQLTGLAAWIADKLQFVQCFTVLSSTAMFIFMLRIIKR
jgi:hypothetical protein